MGDPREVMLVIEQGRTLRMPWRDRIAQTGEVLDPVDAGYTSAVLQVRDKSLSEEGQLLLELSTANGGIVLGAYDDGTGTWWSGYLFCPAATTAQLVPWGEAQYDLVLIHSGGDRDTFRRGPAVLVPAISEVNP